VLAACLQELLIARFEGHWYPDEPHRGCAYRALLNTVCSLDPLLLRAAESTGQRGLQESFSRQFNESGEVHCWINPGEVKVLRGRNQQIIYSDGKGSDNPYEKLRIKIEPTRLAVKVDPVEHVPNSPVSSAQSLVGGAEPFGVFRPPGNTSQGCSSQSQSPTESPMQCWRVASSGPPSMAPLPPHMNSANSNGGYGSFTQAFDGGVGGFDASSTAMRGSFDGSMGNMSGMSMGSASFGNGNGLGMAQQQQSQSASVPHSSPMRGYNSYGTSYGQTPQQPLF
jgi:hypothetical protein